MIVFPMAGLSSRFKQAGFDLPKFRLSAHGRTLFTHAVSGFAPLAAQERLLFITLQQHNATSFVADELTALGLAGDQFDIVELQEPTAGQADTVWLGLNQCGASGDERLTIFNIDTFRPGFAYPKAFDVDQIDGYLEVFRGKGDHWSFARAENNAERSGRVVEVAEKRRISPLCSSGLYVFRTVDLFHEALDSARRDWGADPEAGEQYVAPLYNRLIAVGADIRYQEIDLSEIVFCGTPGEYEAVLQAPNSPT